MEERPYSKREQDNIFDHIKLSLERIEKQVIKTNGRVSTLEKWKWMISGALLILSFIVANNLLDLASLIR